MVGGISASKKNPKKQKNFAINLDMNLFFRCFKKGRNTVDLEQTIRHVCIMCSQSLLVRHCCSYCLRLLIDEEFKDTS